MFTMPYVVESGDGRRPWARSPWRREPPESGKRFLTRWSVLPALGRPGRTDHRRADPRPAAGEVPGRAGTGWRRTWSATAL